MTIHCYILNGLDVVPADPTEWGSWFATADRLVARDEVGGCVISTVFVGLDMNCGHGPPLVFETMLFADDDSFDDLECRRYASWGQAATGHLGMVERVRTWAESVTAECAEAEKKT